MSALRVNSGTRRRATDVRLPTQLGLTDMAHLSDRQNKGYLSTAPRPIRHRRGAVSAAKAAPAAVDQNRSFV